MKLVMTLLVRDEQDIIEANLLYHLEQGVDFFIVTDNRSVDATPEILEHYAQKGLVHVIREERDTYDQPTWVTHMARMACTSFGADWVINNDADEYWWPKKGTLKTSLESVTRKYGAFCATRYNFVGRPDSPGWFFDRLVWREMQSFNYGGKPLRPKTCHRATTDVEVTVGNHNVRSRTLDRTMDGDLIEVLHFPHRSYAQFERGVRLTIEALSRNTSLPAETAKHKRRIYEQFQEGKGPDYYAELILNDEDLHEAEASGRVCLDRRLQQFFNQRLNGMADSYSVNHRRAA